MNELVILIVPKWNLPVVSDSGESGVADRCASFQDSTLVACCIVNVFRLTCKTKRRKREKQKLEAVQASAHPSKQG